MSYKITGINEEYETFLRALKERIRTAQIRAALAVSRELIELYWQIGRDIVSRQEQHSWGNSSIDRLAHDLKTAFPGVEGFSRRNLYRMRAFYLAYRDDIEFVPQVVAQIPWGHNALLLEKVKDRAERLWYAQKTLEHGWSRAVLEAQIETRLYHRQGKATTNFEHTLTPLQSDLAQQILKDPYYFDFLTLADDAVERDMERGLLQHIQKFLLELGAGFAFLGSQYALEVGDEAFYVDLLFYHVRLHCYVVIDLKMKDFQPEFAGKMNFYLSAVDDLLRQRGDAPTIGIILCKTKNRVIAEYALRDINKPIGISEYELGRILPEELQRSLPTVAELEAELQRIEGEGEVSQ